MVINIDTEKCKNLQLAATAAGMVSEDYKERFIAEYIQLKNRFEGLVKMVERWDNGTLPFTPTCPRETYNFQLRAMKDYMDILVVRAKIEEIELP
jgi:hypothetical protein